MAISHSYVNVYQRVNLSFTDHHAVRTEVDVKLAGSTATFLEPVLPQNWKIACRVSLLDVWLVV
jgi:hypothetical protein